MQSFVLEVKLEDNIEKRFKDSGDLYVGVIFYCFQVLHHVFSYFSNVILVCLFLGFKLKLKALIVLAENTERQIESTEWAKMKFIILQNWTCLMLGGFGIIVKIPFGTLVWSQSRIELITLRKVTSQYKILDFFWDYFNVVCFLYLRHS